MILDVVVFPIRSIGEVRVGMTRDEVRLALGTNCEIFSRSANTAVPSDAYSDDGIYVYYKKPDLVEAIEVAHPAQPVMEGFHVLNRSLQSAVEFFKNMDPDLILDDDGLISHALGLAVYAPDASEGTDCPVESLLVFENGYYNRPG